jgi:hypothetical protein
MEKLAINIFLLIFMGSVVFGMAYYYFYEEATVCSYVQNESYVINKHCNCNGWEITKRDTLEKNKGYKETVCIGRVSDRYCTTTMQGRTFETDCK